MDEQTLIQRIANQAQSMIRLVYKDLGDFGGTNPVAQHWILEVAGPYEGMQTLIPTLKSYGFLFDSRSKAWRLDAIFYKFPNRRSDEIAQRNRKRQQEAFPILKGMVQEWNEQARTVNRQLNPAPADAQSLITQMRSMERGQKALAMIGVKVDVQATNSYSAMQTMVWVTGNTYNYRAVFPRLGFKFAQGPFGKGWSIDMDRYTVVMTRMTEEILRIHRETAQAKAELDPTPQGVIRPFDKMNDAELLRFIKQNGLLEEFIEDNEGWDGEVDRDQALRMLMNNLRRQTPRMQEAIVKDRSLR